MTSKNRRCVPQRKVLYQFSARGHEVTQVLLGSQSHRRSRRGGRLLSVSAAAADLGLVARGGARLDHDARGRHERRPRYRRGVQSAAQPGRLRACRCAAEWARNTRPRWAGLRRCAIAARRSAMRIAPTASRWRTAAMHRRPPTDFWAALNIVTTERLPLLVLHRGQRLRHFGAVAAADAGRQHRREISTAFGGLRVLDGDGSDPLAAAALIEDAVTGVRSGGGPALLRLTVPRLSGPLRPGHPGLQERGGNRRRARARSAAEASRAAGARAFMSSRRLGI